MATWLLANSTTVIGTMVGTPLGAVAGFGAVAVGGSAVSFGTALATSISGSANAAAIAKWTTVGQAIISHLTSLGQVLPSAWLYNVVSGGAVSGPGTIAFSSPTMSPRLSAQLSFVDTASVNTWNTIEAAIVAHLVANSAALATGFTCPAGGGPLVGIGLIT